MIEQLAHDYASQVIFLEYNSLDPRSIDRMDRWWAGYGGTNANLPLTMVDSGFSTHAGFSNAAMSYAQHEAMILDALDRPPQADLSATWERNGDAVRFNIQVTNRSGETLSSDNFAAVHAIVYEDNFVLYTGRFVRAHAAAPVGELEDDATGSYVINTPALVDVDWSKLHFITLIDYLTPAGPFDMLQAAVAMPTHSTLSVSPATLIFQAPVGGPNPVEQSVNVTGPTGAAWSSSETVAWMQVSPATGAMPGNPAVSVRVDGLDEGIYSGKIRFTSGSSSQDITVLATVGELYWVNIPLVIR